MTTPDPGTSGPIVIRLPKNDTSTVMTDVSFIDGTFLPLTESSVVPYIKGVYAAVGAAKDAHGGDLPPDAPVRFAVDVPDRGIFDVEMKSSGALAEVEQLMQAAERWFDEMVVIPEDPKAARSILFPREGGRPPLLISSDAADRLAKILIARADEMSARGRDEDGVIHFPFRFAGGPSCRAGVRVAGAREIAKVLVEAAALQRRRALANGQPIGEITEVVERDDNGFVVRTEKQLIY